MTKDEKKNFNARPLTVRIPITCDQYEFVCGFINLYRHIARKTAAALCAAELAKANVAINEDGFLTLEHNKPEILDQLFALCFPGERKRSLDNMIVTALENHKRIQSEFAVKRRDEFEKEQKKKTPSDEEERKKHENKIKTMAEGLLRLPRNTDAALWSGDMIQECARAITSKWRAKDAVKKIQRRTRVLTGDGFPTQFNFAAVPIKHCDTCRGNIKFFTHEVEIEEEKNGVKKKRTVIRHTISIKLTRGDPIMFKIKKCEPQVWRVIKALASENKNDPSFRDFALDSMGYAIPAGAHLNLDNSGKLWLYLGFYKNVEAVAVDPDKTLEVFLDQEGWGAKIVDGETLIDQIRRDEFAVDAAIDIVDRLEKQRQRMDKLLASSTRMTSARKSIRDRSEALADARSKNIEKWSHTWANAFVHAAISFKCGRILFHQPAPVEFVIDGKSVSISGIRQRSWPFFDLRNKIEYKAELKGIKFSHRQEVAED